jgi:ferric-dicitrate binding protein FerR (iron transport regulator)
MIIRLGPAGFLIAFTMLAGGAAHAQPRGCETVRLLEPAREVIRCGGRVTITSEPGSSYRVTGRDRSGIPTGVQLRKGGLLLEVPGGGGSFQIQTPHAVASVRGTTWAVDVTPQQTSVFVQEGAVAVRKISAAPTVVLASGEGVDVQPDQPLVVRRWGRERAWRLLARFGR